MRTTLALALLLATPLAASAYDIDQLRKDARAYHDAMMKKVVDLTIEQETTFTAPGRGSNTVKSTMYKKGDRWRNEGSMTMADAGGGSIDTITLFDGADVWSATMGMKTKVAPGEAQSQGAASYWVEPAVGSRIVGQDEVSGRECWIVQGPDTPAPEDGMSPRRMWIDKKTYLWVQTEGVASNRTIRMTLSDFRPVEGFDFPYRIDLLSDGKPMMTTKIVKVETNRRLSDDLFDPAKLSGSEMPAMGAPGEGGMPSQADMDAIMKQAEAMKEQFEEMQKQQGK